MADTYSLQDSDYPRITYNAKKQKLKGQQNPVSELTASIGDCTSTNYFLIKDSLPQGIKASPEQLTHLRPDIVSVRIATNLDIVQPTAITASATIPPTNIGIPSTAPVQIATMPTQVTPGAMPTSHAPSMSKAQAIAQTVTPATHLPSTPAPTPNTAVASLAALAAPLPLPLPHQANTQHSPASTEADNFALNNSTAPIANQVSNANIAVPPTSPPISQQRDYSSGLRFRESRAQPESIHNPQRANCIFLPFQPKEVLPYSLTSADLALIGIAPGMEGVVAPSKLYGVMAAGVAIAAICAPHSYLRSLLPNIGCGACFDNKDAEKLAKFIRLLVTDRQKAQEMGLRGRKYLLENFTPQIIAQRYAEIIKN